MIPGALSVVNCPARDSFEEGVFNTLNKQYGDASVLLRRLKEHHENLTESSTNQEKLGKIKQDYTREELELLWKKMNSAYSDTMKEALKHTKILQEQISNKQAMSYIHDILLPPSQPSSWIFTFSGGYSFGMQYRLTQFSDLLKKHSSWNKPDDQLVLNVTVLSKADQQKLFKGRKTLDHLEILRERIRILIAANNLSASQPEATRIITSIIQHENEIFQKFDIEKSVKFFEDVDTVLKKDSEDLENKSKKLQLEVFKTTNHKGSLSKAKKMEDICNRKMANCRLQAECLLTSPILRKRYEENVHLFKPFKFPSLKETPPTQKTDYRSLPSIVDPFICRVFTLTDEVGEKYKRSLRNFTVMDKLNLTEQYKDKIFKITADTLTKLKDSSSKMINESEVFRKENANSIVDLQSTVKKFQKCQSDIDLVLAEGNEIIKKIQKIFTDHLPTPVVISGASSSSISTSSSSPASSSTSSSSTNTSSQVSTSSISDWFSYYLGLNQSTPVKIPTLPLSFTHPSMESSSSSSSTSLNIKEPIHVEETAKVRAEKEHLENLKAQQTTQQSQEKIGKDHKEMHEDSAKAASKKIRTTSRNELPKKTWVRVVGSKAKN